MAGLRRGMRCAVPRAFHSSPRKKLESSQPSTSGVREPVTAMAIPRSPMSLSMAKSTSRPASSTSSIRPTSPKSISASGTGIRSASGGPSTTPTRISPTSVGRPSLEAALPAHQMLANEKVSRMTRLKSWCSSLPSLWLLESSCTTVWVAQLTFDALNSCDSTRRS